MKFGLKVKLVGSFSVVLALMITVAYLGIRLGAQTYADVENLGEKQVHKVELGGLMQERLADMKRYQLEVVFRGLMNDDKKMTEYTEKVDQLAEEINKSSTEWEKMFETEAAKKKIKEFNDILKEYIDTDLRVRKLVQDKKISEAMVLVDGEAYQDYENLMGKLDEVSVIVNDFVDSVMTQSEKEYKDTRTVSIAITVAALIIGIIIALFISISIVKVVNQIKFMLQDMAESGGDLTKRIQVTSKDEIGELALWFNTFLDKLHDIISQIRQSADAVASAANETSLGNQDLSQRTEEQASSLEEISSTIEEVTASLQKSSESSSEADVSSRSTLDKVHKGETVVNELHGAMVEITKGSHAIAEIIAKVNDIAFQTNLLALNAAVEAARAGEQGRGFAVVAAEVRNLAGRTAESAKEIEGLIKESIQKVEHGNELMEQTATVLDDIVQNTQKTTDVIAEIASSMREQSAAAGDIRTAVEQLNQVTQQNASLVEEIAGSSEAVSNEAEEMSALVGKFKLNNYTGQQAGNKVAKVTRLPKKELNYSSAKLVAAAGEPRNSRQDERLAANFNENDFDKF